MAFDRVRTLKIEKPSTGGTQTDVYPTGVDPNEDALDVRGVALQNDSSDDEVAVISRDASNNMTFKDGANATEVTLTDLLSGEGGGDDDQVDTVVAEGETFTVQTEHQHILFEELTVEGEYVVDGETILLGGDETGSAEHESDTDNPHQTDIGNLGSGTLAELNTAITDATLDDSSSARTPSAHATSHQSGGGDAVKLDDLAAPDDNTDLDASVSAHGLLPKLGGGTTNFLRADGTWAAPAASAPNVLQVERLTSWAATNFSSATPVPFDNKSIEGDTGITTWSSGDATKIEFGVSGDYLVTAVAQLISTTSGFTYDLQAWLRKNGSTELPATRVTLKNWEAETQPIVIASYMYSFLDTDYLEFVFDHAGNLAGNLSYCRLTIAKLY